ncbi:MAG: gamma-glutamyltransferase, partial [Verrucomicrobiales bacterium]|nr:gamma-glutamyltransferase [Verrucomicrobiales bacterium]
MNCSRSLVLLIALTNSALRADTPTTSFTHGAAATVQPLATEAAIAAMKRGGNAVDAAIAAALTLGVVDGHNSGLGGGCFIVIRAADGSVTAIDGREMAPAAASRDMYVINGKLDTEASKTGPLASGIPGALAAYSLALEKHGKLKLADLAVPAAELAERGFPIDEVYARKLVAMLPHLKKFPATAAILLHADGTPLNEGEVLVQKDLGATLRAIAAGGTDWFYRGPFAEKVGAWMAANGGLITAADFATYVAQDRAALRTRYRGYEIVGMPPPSSGGIHVAQILQMVEGFPVRHLRDASRVHLFTEAMKLAFADRAFWLGDPDFAKVPRGLIDPIYTGSLAQKIDLDHTSPVPQHGEPMNWAGDLFGKHTTHLSTADAAGNWVALTQTINTGFGSKVIVPGTGVLLNNEMDDFSTQPGVPNAFRLIGAEANAIAPKKRPLSSMSPTLVLRDGRPLLSVGAAGGPTIITQTLLTLTHIIDDGMTPTEA